MKDVNRKVVITVDKNQTFARIYDNNVVVAKGVATCSPEDTFDFKVGSELALSRALEAIKPKESPKKQEWVVVDRKPRVGDYIRVIYKGYPFGDYGEVLKVSKVTNNGYVSIKISDHPKCRKYLDKNGGWLFDDWVYNSKEYVVVEPASKKPEFRKITRLPKRGDYMKVISSPYSFEKGDKEELVKIHKVYSAYNSVIAVEVLHNDHPRAVKEYGMNYCYDWHYNCEFNDFEFYEKVDDAVEVYNGKRFRKVDREVRAGDYIKLSKPFFTFDTTTDFLKVDHVSTENCKTIPHVRHADNPGAVEYGKTSLCTFRDNYIWNYWKFTGNVYECLDD
jgi:hypothetical protein